MPRDVLKTITKNAGYLFFSDVIVKIIAFVTSIYLARYLSVENYGILNFLIVYFSFFNIIGVFGLDTVVLRDIARSREEESLIMSNALSIRLITSIASILLSIFCIRFINNSNSMYTYVTITSIILLFQNISYLNESLFKAREKMEYYAYTIVFYKLSFALLVACIIVFQKDIIWLLAALVVSEFIRTLISYFYIRTASHYKLRFDLKYWKYLVREAVPFLVNSFLYIIHYRIDVIMLSILVDNISVGIYSAAYKLTDPLLFIPSAITVSLFPLITRQYISKRESMEKTFIQSTKLIFLIVLPMAIGIYVLSEKLILLVFGGEYYESIRVLQILIGSLVFNSLASMQSSLLISSNKQKLITFSVIVSCIVNISLNYLLIPYFSHVGAAIATLISVFMLYTLENHYIKSKLNISSNYNYLKPAFCAFIMGAIIYYLQENNIWVLIILGVSIYVLLLISLKALEKDDVKLITTFLRRDGKDDKTKSNVSNR